MPGSGYSTEQIGKGTGTSVYDVFISHASEDKDTFVRPLAVALDALGVTVWYDEFSLRPGDSISRSIDKGIAGSQCGLVVISRAFIEKPWPEYELRGLVTREIGGAATIVPIWHGVGKEEVASFSPPLADKLAIRTDESTAADVALQVVAAVCPDIYRSHPRASWQSLPAAMPSGHCRLNSIPCARTWLDSSARTAVRFRSSTDSMALMKTRSKSPFMNAVIMSKTADRFGCATATRTFPALMNTTWNITNTPEAFGNAPHGRRPNTRTSIDLAQ